MSPAMLRESGEDYLLSIWGGAGLIGASGHGPPKAKPSDPARLSATASVFCHAGHEEDDIANQVSERLPSALGTIVVVDAGMHWDNPTAYGIEQVKKTAAELVKLIVEAKKNTSS